MGILRVKEDLKDIIDRDPYELINLDEPHQLVRRLAPQYYGAAFVGVLVAFTAAFITFYNASRQNLDQYETVHAYFEIKAIDSEGRTVTGATVSHNDEQVGVTDSFGEWRRFLRVTPGETYRIQLKKSTPTGDLVAVKNLAVPAKVPENGDLELTGSVKMFRAGKARDMRKSDSAADAVQADAGTPVETNEAVPVQGQVGAAPAAMMALSSIWFVADGAKSAVLNDLVANLRRRSLELGLRVDPDSPFRIRLRAIGGDLSVKLGKASPVLIRTTGTYALEQKHEELFSYLRNFQDTPNQTARDILWAMTVHTKIPVAVIRDGANWRLAGGLPAVWGINARFMTDGKGSMYFAAAKPGDAYAIIDGNEFPEVCGKGLNSCVLTTAGITEASPVYGWQKLTAKTSGRVDAHTRIYISGYEAEKLADGQISYWGIAGGQANLTVIRGDKVLLRRRVTHSDHLTIALPTAVISRR